jgi:hypothetical protein
MVKTILYENSSNFNKSIEEIRYLNYMSNKIFPRCFKFTDKESLLNDLFRDASLSMKSAFNQFGNFKGFIFQDSDALIFSKNILADNKLSNLSSEELRYYQNKLSTTGKYTSYSAPSQTCPKTGTSYIPVIKLIWN